MRRFLILPLTIAAVVAIEALYRWSNGLDLGWSWLAYRTAVLAAIFLFSSWSARREARRSRTGGPAKSSVWLPILFTLFGGTGLIVSIWRIADALLTGRVIVSTMPDVYTAWQANPSGFAVAVGLDVFVLAFLALLLLGGLAMLWNHFRGRYGPTWP